MEYRLNLSTLDNPEDLLKLKTALSEIADEADTLYTETAPNGNISARIGRRAIYNNGGTYTSWVNIDGGTTWRQMTDNDTNVMHLTGDETAAGIKTFSSIPVLPASNPTTANQATRKQYVDDYFNTSTGHDHDGSDSKKVLATNLDPTGVTDGHFLKNSGGAIVGSAISLQSASFKVKFETATATWAETEGFDNGGNFASNTFTAPYTGYYTFQLSIFYSGTANANNNVSATLAIAGTSTATHIANFSFLNNDPVNESLSLSVTVHMTASDTATMTVSGTTSNVAPTTGDISKSWWSGFLIPASV